MTYKSYSTYTTSDLQSKQRQILLEAESQPVYIRRKGVYFILQAVRNERDTTCKSMEDVVAEKRITQAQLDLVRGMEDLWRRNRRIILKQKNLKYAVE